MITTCDHFAHSSFLLWLSNLLNSKGQAIVSGSGFFYDTQEVYGGRFSYSSPFRPFVADSGIPGVISQESSTVKRANVISGVYLDGTFITTGQSGLTGINYEKGTVYFISGLTYVNNPAHSRLSGNFIVSEFSYKLTNEPEENLLFETKYSLKPRTNQTISGLGPSEVTYPIIYVKPLQSHNKEWSLGGTEEIVNTYRLIILAESQFQLDGAISLIRDKTRCVLPLLTGVSEMPFNAFGGYASKIYCYNTTFTGKYSTSNSAFLMDVRTARLASQGFGELKRINPQVFASIVDCDISSYRVTRV